MALIRRRDFHLENEIPGAFRGTRSALGATFEAADKYGWSLVHPVSANPNPSGIVADDAFEEICGMIIGAAAVKGPIDGALLHLHGAMVTDSHEDAEGELLARLRQTLGPQIPIVATLDLHANVTRKMADNANALIAFRTYPHVDMYERAWQGAELLERAMRGEIRPVTVIARRPMLHGLDWGRHQSPPMAELLARADAIEQRREGLAVSICAGFALANIQRCRPLGNRHERSNARHRRDRSTDRRRLHGPCMGHARFYQRPYAQCRRGSCPRARGQAWRQAARHRRLYRQSGRRRVWRCDGVSERLGRRQCRARGVSRDLRCRSCSSRHARRGRHPNRL